MASCYPGENVTAAELCRLADGYRRAADTLWLVNGTAPPAAPLRFVALHAIELYLNAFLLARGRDMPAIRAVHHDLARRVTLAGNAGLVLRLRTRDHLIAMGADRDYLRARYDPSAFGSTCPSNRLRATLTEVADKVCRAVAAPVPAPAIARAA